MKLLRLSIEGIILLYAAAFFLVTLGIHLAYFPIGDIGVESDFYGELVVSAKALVAHHFSVENYPYKGPFYSFALVFVRLFCRDWYLSGVILNGLCAAASLIILFRLLSRMFDRTVALLTTLAVSLGVEYFTLAHKASSDMLFAFLCLCAISFLFREGYSRRNIILGGILSACAFLTRYTGACLPVTMVAMLVVNPGRWTRRCRSEAALIYFGVFLAACAPWFIMSYRETGNLLATRNIESIVREFYGGDGTEGAPEGGFTSMAQVFTHDPMHFIGHYLLNIPSHFWLDMRGFLGIDAGILVMIGMLRLIVRPPTRMQWAFYIFAISYFLLLCTVFYLSRFSILLSPAYFAVLFSMLLGLGEKRRSAPARREQAPRAGAEAARIFGIIPRTFLGAAATAVLAVLLLTRITGIVEAEKSYYKLRPLPVIDAARFLKEYVAGENRPGQATIMARKAHIAYYADLAYARYPRQFSVPYGLLRYARNRKIDFLVYGNIERYYFRHREVPEGWKALASADGVKTVYSTPSITIYEISHGNPSAPGRR
ncbi:MAG: glycosyltransferase family 39 protein [Candidatus Krumholzibacteria bacterium]|nr:glycosyltransferase family 39 protein [Candidatus Krumholzibacteria bacterium]